MTAVGVNVGGMVLAVVMDEIGQQIASAGGADSTVVAADVPALPVPAAGVSDDRCLSAVFMDALAGMVDGVVTIDRVIAQAMASRAQMIDATRQWAEITEDVIHEGSSEPGGWNAATVARRTVETEIACALRIPERSAQNLVAESKSLVHDMPATMDALQEGEFSYWHARTIMDHALSVPDAARPEFEAKLVKSAKTLTVAKLNRKARLMRERSHPETITERYVKKVTDRRVSVEPAPDGMAWLEAFLPAVDAFGIRDRLGQIVTGLKTADEPRSRTQLTADVFTDLLIDGTTETGDAADDGHASRVGVGVGGGVRATVMVTVPVLSLLGHSDEPATLEGYGPIDWPTAKRLTAGAPSFTRILTHPETGVVLSVGRDQYKVPKDLRRYLRLRDGTCRFPGCNRAAKDCDIDHSLDWQYHGETRGDNLAHLCKGAHALKHHTAWKVKQAPGGVLDWTSPSGHTYRTEPETQIGPAPPESALQGDRPRFTELMSHRQPLPDDAPF